MAPSISVIICTHNPRSHYLDKVLQSLEAQTLAAIEWELLLIDNASDQVLASTIDLTWHPNARHIREEQLGLTPARLKGIQEAQAETLIFVDDDNVLDADYLEIALNISKDCPHLGAWGGQTRPGFEVQPPEWTKTYWPQLAIREFDQDKWSNLLHQHETTPCGAGMCMRKVVAEKYAYLVKNDPRRSGLDRTGKGLMSGGDSDLAFTACDIGLGTGLFTALKLTHLMPPGRLEEAYLIKLIEGMWYSNRILDSFRGRIPAQQHPSWRWQLVWGSINRLIETLELLKLGARDRRFYEAKKRGDALGLQAVYQAQKETTLETR